MPSSCTHSFLTNYPDLPFRLSRHCATTTLFISTAVTGATDDLLRHLSLMESEMAKKCPSMRSPLALIFFESYHCETTIATYIPLLHCIHPQAVFCLVRFSDTWNEVREEKTELSGRN